jgi:hypothetical protein
MGTTTTMKIGVNLLTQAVVYQVNTLQQLGYRISHGRVPNSRYMVDNQEVIERGLRVWLTEQKLEKVYYEIYDPAATEALERCEVELEYLADPTVVGEVRKPPIQQLEELFAKLEKLPPEAEFRLVVTVGPDASDVPGWGPSRLYDLAGGVKESHKVGSAEGFGFGGVSGHTTYYVSKGSGSGQKPA